MSNPRPVADREIQRILALVPWLVAHPGVQKSEVRERFQLSEAQLERDLELMLMVGVPPYTPGDYIDVDDDGDTITLRMADSFRRPPRLTAPEGLAVLAAGRALVAVPGSDTDGPLATALLKLSAALGNPDVDVSIGEPEYLSVIRAAVETAHEVELDYWTASRDVVTTRRVQPTTVFFAEGQWYLEAFCHAANDDRLFRVDRIRAAHTTEIRFRAPAEYELRDALYQPRDADPTFALTVDPAHRWVGEYYPTEAIEDLDAGYQRIVLRVSELAFLERLVLRLGAGVTVECLSGASEFSGAWSAARVLSRYGA